MNINSDVGPENLQRQWRFLTLSTVLVILIGALSFTNSAHAAVWQITYPKSLVENDEREIYPIALLHLALDKTGVRYEIKPSAVPIRQARAIKRLEENLDINVVWTMTDVQREQDLTPIRIPIDKGLIGWRVLLAHKDNELHARNIQTVEQLMQFSAVQGLSWPDTKILQANGFNVLTGRDYIESKALVLEGAGDFFPRSVIEVQSELNNSASQPLMIKDGVVINYPAAMYFFVNKQNKTLARLIETGLEKAIVDGSFDELFHAYFDDTISELKIKDARHFDLSNPLLPLATPINRPELWYRPRDTQ